MSLKQIVAAGVALSLTAAPVLAQEAPVRSAPAVVDASELGGENNFALIVAGIVVAIVGIIILIDDSSDDDDVAISR